MPESLPEELCVFTIGHSNHDEETFIELLKRYEIDVVADVRSQPYSRYTTHFNADQIKTVLGTAGIRYTFLGQLLGGRPDSAEFYDADGYVLYDRLAVSLSFEQGLERLLDGVPEHRVSLLCSEENPAECHRNLLIGRVLIERDVEVFHIRGDGRLQSQEEVQRESSKRDPRQTFLFEEAKEMPWKSIRSVLPKRGRPSSSES